MFRNGPCLAIYIISNRTESIIKTPLGVRGMNWWEDYVRETHQQQQQHIVNGFIRLIFKHMHAE